MREATQSKAGRYPVTPLPGGRRRWAGVSLCVLGVWAGLLFWPGAGLAQTMRVGNLDLTLVGTLSLAYDSNVDDVYPEEETPGMIKDDFYLLPSLSIQSQTLTMWPRITFNVSGMIGYEDYFRRNDLDTEVYNVAVNFQTTHPRLTLGGMASVDYSVEGIADQYVPGGASRDPVLTLTANGFANWNYRKLRLEFSEDYNREMHRFEQYQAGDQEEITTTASIFLDVFRWGSLFYTWERAVTTQLQSEQETTEITQTFGIDGSIPVDILRRPKITYQFGFSYEDEQTDTSPEREEPTWQPTHSITVMDEFDLSKSIHLSLSATWEDTWENNTPDFTLPGQNKDDEDDEVTFQYNIKLTQLLGPRAQHSLTFTQEPEATFGSNTDTESTTYGYDFSLQDLLVYGLNFNFSAVYELETPLGVPHPETEKTTTFTTGLVHTRQLSRKLSRNLSYEYTWENSNFHQDGANEKHLVMYTLVYAF